MDHEDVVKVTYIYIYTLHNKHENHENLMQNQQKKPEIVYTDCHDIFYYELVSL